MSTDVYGCLRMSTDVYGARPARWLGVNRKLEVWQESGFISWKIHGTSMEHPSIFMDDHWVYSTGFTVPGKSKWVIDMALPIWPCTITRLQSTGIHPSQHCRLCFATDANHAMLFGKSLVISCQTTKPTSPKIHKTLRIWGETTCRPATVLLPILHSLTTMSRYFWGTTNKAAIISSPLISLRCLLHSFGYWIDMVNKIHFFRYGNGFVAKSFSLRPGGRAAGRWHAAPSTMWNDYSHAQSLVVHICKILWWSFVPEFWDSNSVNEDLSKPH